MFFVDVISVPTRVLSLDKLPEELPGIKLIVPVVQSFI
jgi:hypothetical protein